SVYIPWGYEVPEFPSLSWPTTSRMDTKYYLYYRKDIWRFTCLWTIIVYEVVHFAAGLWAALMSRRLKSFVILAIYMFVGGVGGIISGSIIGAILGLIYSAGAFAMSTWIPFVWAVVQILTLIMTSYSMSAIVM
ncbi:uncharacterized protein V2V93DRAFT_328407, partial [Kockiozyma suomiensis]|uniref:uncharacterized protein n=1 Tax=Kockiozyma suomiensis TaxID=1337062 RepID=UPI0033430A05